MVKRKIRLIKRTTDSVSAEPAEPIGTVVEDTPVTGDSDSPTESASGNAGDTSDVETIEPAVIFGEPDSSDAPSEPRRKRGRPAGVRNGSGKSTTTKKSATNLENLLYVVHFQLANISKNKTLMLDPEEAQAVAKCVTDVTEFYGKSDFISPEVMLWLGVLGTLGKVYGTRAWLLWQQGNENKAAKTVTQPGPQPVPDVIPPQPKQPEKKKSIDFTLIPAGAIDSFN